MTKIAVLVAWMGIAMGIAVAQQKGAGVKFDPKRDAQQDIQAAIKEAQASHRRIILDVGGEWCSWCHILDKFFADHAELSELRDQYYVWVKVNFSRENENEKVLGQYPKIPGYPHLLVLEENGKFLYSQRTSPLEEGKSYNLGPVTEFLEKWKPSR